MDETSRATPDHEPIERNAEQRPAGFQWECADGIFRAHADWLAFLPIYYTSHGNTIFLSTSFTEVACRAHRLSLDCDALAVRLRLGQFIGEETAFHEIRTLPPNAEIECSAGGVDVRGRVHLPEASPMSRDAAIDDYIERFRASVARLAHTSRAYVMPLTGGRDSRHILYELARLKRLPARCFTTYEFPPHSTMEDIRIARLLCEHLNIRHEVVEQPHRGLPIEGKKNLLTDFGSFEHAWSVRLAHRLADDGPVVWDGIGGDFLSGGAQLHAEDVRLYDDGRHEALVQKIIDRWGYYDGLDPALDRVLQPQFRGRMSLEVAREKIVVALAQVSDAPNPLAAFYFWHRARRSIALIPYRVFQRHGLHPLCPYLDRDVYELLASLPTHMTSDKQFHNDAISRAFPQFDRIPYEQKSAGFRQWRGYTQRWLFDLAGFIAANGTGAIVKTDFLVPRLLQTACSPRARRKNWLAPDAALLLCQLEAFMASMSGHGAGENRPRS